MRLRVVLFSRFAGTGLGVFGFIRVRVGSLVRTKGSSSSIGFAWVHSGATKDLRVHSSLRGFT